MAINYNGDIAVVLDMQHRTPATCAPLCRPPSAASAPANPPTCASARTEKIEPVPMITKKMEYSYKDGADYVFTDSETYETVTLARNWLATRKIISWKCLDHRDLCRGKGGVHRTAVERGVDGVDAPEGIRGDSSNNVQKPVTLETGITVQVPLFIKTGEKIKVDTRTGKYMERA